MPYELDEDMDLEIKKTEELKSVVRLIEEDIFVNSEDQVRFDYISNVSMWTFKMWGSCYLAFFTVLFLFFSIFGWWFVAKILVGGFLSLFATMGVSTLLEENVFLRFFLYENSIKKMLNKFSNADEFSAFMAASLTARTTHKYDSNEKAKSEIKNQISAVYDGVNDYYKTGKLAFSAKNGLILFMMGLAEDISSLKTNTLRDEKFSNYVDNVGDTLKFATESYLGKKDSGNDNYSRDRLMNVEKKYD